MSNKERCYQIIDSFSESQLAQIAAMLQATKNAIDEAADDAFCDALYERYLKDPDKGDPVPLEDFAKELGIQL